MHITAADILIYICLYIYILFYIYIYGGTFKYIFGKMNPFPKNFEGLRVNAQFKIQKLTGTVDPYGEPLVSSRSEISASTGWRSRNPCIRWTWSGGPAGSGGGALLALPVVPHKAVAEVSKIGNL